MKDLSTGRTLYALLCVRSAVLSTIALQKAKIASGLPRNCGGMRAISGSRPTQSRPCVFTAAWSRWENVGIVCVL